MHRRHLIAPALARRVAGPFLGAVVIAGAVVVVPASAYAASASPNSLCSGERHGRAVKQTAVSYTSLGTAAGKYNPNRTNEGLTVTMSRTLTTSSSWEAGASGTLKFGIAEVQATTKYTVTKQTTTSKSVTDPMTIPGHHYGYAQPKAEKRTYHIYDWVEEKSCHIAVTKNWGYFRAITAYPFFSECVATKPCTPKP